MRERGLKLPQHIVIDGRIGRSREGAWIEIAGFRRPLMPGQVAPVRERGLKSNALPEAFGENEVAPVRERGLKYE